MVTFLRVVEAALRGECEEYLADITALAALWMIGARCAERSIQQRTHACAVQVHAGGVALVKARDMVVVACRSE